ncbi:ABC-2 transporter permease [Streptacidiphilus sp. ASG 303]|uniref:ABC transporter permease n=1 Tax=Streptacidiphilus sp. ASG 303 TaxID=2896847 RepID=UPI001E466195|nr:ABC transporter permease [Streptacidiphilus sp. ASG 303]MCD0483724.1 ABC-2 transporter permease [Streptacidiphilus sp. ASG 303]
MVTVLTVGLVFVGVFLAAFHTPKAHRLPVAVVASDQGAALFDVGLQRMEPDAFQVERYADEGSARSALFHRRVYAAYIEHGGTRRVLFAGANGLAVQALVAPLGHTLQGAGGKVHTEDVLPLSGGDSRGLSVFYASFGLALAGFLFGQMTYQVAPRLSFRQRMASLGIFAVVGGLATSLIAHTVFDAIPGPFLGIAAVVALMSGAVGAATVLLIRVFGALGVPLGSIFMLVMGNATSGGVLPPSFLPGWLQPMASVMPPGVGVRALDGLAYFHHDGVGSGLVVLGVWLLVCVGGVFTLDRIAVSSGIVHAAQRGRPAAVHRHRRKGETA